MFDIRHSRGASLFARLMLGTTLSVIAIAAARAQADNNTETVVVTGTSIRGTPPVGANLITVDRATIESTGAQTVQQLLSTVPQINTFGGSGQGGSNSDFTGGFAPAIHSIGGGSSSATLVLINGHRFPTQGLTEANADPTVIPASALERVEVLPDGASSIYGSDAVAGVVNFITRKASRDSRSMPRPALRTTIAISPQARWWGIPGIAARFWPPMTIRASQIL